VARTSEFDRSGSVASLERAPDRYLILSPDLDIIGVTQAYLDATMTCRADIVGRHLFDVFPDNPADPAADGVRNLHASLKRVLASGAPDEMPVQKYDVRRPSGDGGGFQEKYWKPLNAPVLEHDGSIAYIVHRVDDVTTAITDRRAAATALSDSEENFGFVANNIPQFAWMADTSGSIFWYNRRWFDYTGTTLEQMRGWGWQKVHHPDHVDRVVAVIKHAFDTGEDWEDTFPLRGTDGTYRWFLSRARPIRDRDGMIMRWFGTNTDITEQRQAEQALRESEEFNRRILASSTDCIKVLDLDGKLRFMSEGAQEAMEIDDFASVDGCTWLDFWNGPHAEAARFAVEEARAGRVGQFQGGAPTAKGNARWWDVRISAIRGADGEPAKLLSVSRDITVAHDAEMNSRKLNEELESRVNERTETLRRSNEALLKEISQREAAEAQVRQMQKIEAIGQLTGGIAHDFNNMLAVIISGCGLMERRIARGEDITKYLQGVRDAADRAASLTHRLLAFSRQLPLSPGAIDPNRMVNSMSELLQRTIGEDIRLETVLAGGLWGAHADPSQLENSILNLAINSRDAMPKGGKLTIETGNAHLDDEYARDQGDVAAGQYVMIAVSDTGEGMTREVIERAFDPFFTTKPVGKGTGLGLSQVYGFVKQSKGHLKLYSEVGHGTTVKIYLPRIFGETENHASPTTARPTPTGTLAELILVVEDETRIREITTDSLRELGYGVVHAASGAAALKLLREREDIGLLFTDIVMPDMNGRQLADAAHEMRPGLKVLYTTGYTRNAIVHNGVLDPGVNFIAKPFTLDQLGNKIREVLS
jgi:PAS domain S-box-containing protein